MALDSPLASAVPDVIFLPTPIDSVEQMLKLAEIRRDELVYDLGCGDGRICTLAAEMYGARAVGFDIDPVRVEEARARVRSCGLQDRVTIHHANLFDVDLSPADVVTLYLLPQLNVRLIPQLRLLRPGARIVSHRFDMAGTRPSEAVLYSPWDSYQRFIFLWHAPLQDNDASLE